MKQSDLDSDGIISKTEFVPMDETNEETRISLEENFADLDKNKDGSLSAEEFRPWVLPGHDDLAEEEVDHLMSMADGNGDNRLSMDEILDKTDEFVGSSATDYGNMLQHEEL